MEDEIYDEDTAPVAESSEEKKLCWKCILFGDKMTGFLGVLAGVGILAVGIDLMTNGRFLRMFANSAPFLPADNANVWDQKAREALEDEDIDEIDTAGE